MLFHIDHKTGKPLIWGLIKQWTAGFIWYSSPNCKDPVPMMYEWYVTEPFCNMVAVCPD